MDDTEETRLHIKQEKAALELALASSINNLVSVFSHQTACRVKGIEIVPSMTDESFPDEFSVKVALDLGL